MLRHRARLTQAELAALSGVGRWKIGKIEAGQLADLRFGDVEACLAALDAVLVVSASYHGAAGDRLLDEQHAGLVTLMVALLRRYGWEVRVEVSFSEYGERGSVDILAWHPQFRALLVIEVKSELGSIEGTLRPFDIKCRLAPKLARERFGWQPRSVGRMLVLPDDRTARRAVERHQHALSAALPARSRRLRAWLRDAGEPIGGIWFLSGAGSTGTTRNPSAIRRVRRPRPRSVDGRRAGPRPPADPPTGVTSAGPTGGGKSASPAA